MKRALHAETLKLATTRSYAGLVAGAVAVAGLGTVSTMSAVDSEQVRLADQQFFLIATTNLALFAVILGVKSSTDDFRHGTVVLSALLEPGRLRTVVAKAVTAAVAAAGLAAVALTAMVALATALGWSGSDMGDVGSDWQALGGLTAATATWAVIGVSIGELLRQQVPSVLIGVVWVLLVENLGAGLLEDDARWLPGQAAHALAGASTVGTGLAPGAAGAVLALYAVAAIAVAGISFRRRDV